MTPSRSWVKNPYLRNPKMADVYLYVLRKGWRTGIRLVEMAVSCQIGCPVPERLFLPHPIGIVCGTHCELGNDVVLMQHVTLGGRHPYYDPARDPYKTDPILEEGVYVGPGAAVLGFIRIGAWSLIGANAVVTEDVPPYSIVVGHNKILGKKTTEL